MLCFYLPGLTFGLLQVQTIKNETIPIDVDQSSSVPHQSAAHTLFEAIDLE
jgi:hypothetical protein